VFGGQSCSLGRRAHTRTDRLSEVIRHFLRLKVRASGVDRKRECRRVGWNWEGMGVTVRKGEGVAEEGMAIAPDVSSLGAQEGTFEGLFD
jgi:hypothetical protein